MSTPQPGQRHTIRLAFEKDTRARTSKCKICGERIKNFAHRCTHCRTRICSDCSEADGGNSEEHKAVAGDYLTYGCWCGFPSNFNPEFAGRMPGVSPKPSVAKKAVLRSGLQDNVANGEAEDEDTSDDNSSPLSSPQSSSVQGHAEETVDSQSPLEKTSSSQNSNSSTSSSQPSDPTYSTPTTTVSRKRSRKSRDEEPEYGDLPLATTRRSRDSDESEDAAKKTVIIGAGHVGLFIAYELGKKAEDSGVKHCITVVEMNDSPCELASGHSTGLVTVQGMREEWLPLVEAATTAWTELRERTEFRDAVNFSTRVSAVASASDNDDDDATPSPPWLKLEPGQYLVSDTNTGGGTLGKVNVAQLTAFLQQQCEALKVKFQYGMHICKINWTRTGHMTGIQIKTPTANSLTAKTLPCNDLILATGPYTKDVFSTYFPDTPLPLRNYAQRSEWLSLRHPVGRSEAVVIPGEGHPLTAPPISIVASAAKGALQLSAVESGLLGKQVTIGDMFDQERKMSPGMRELALRHITPIPNKTAPIESGTALVGTANGQNPMLGKVPSEVGGDVWLCYGFGHFGTTLAPGVGKIMAEMFMGEESSVDVSLFAVPEAH